MKLGYNLNLEQTQKLMMTTELRQAIEILQLNSIELRDYMTRELEENPMLEPDSSSNLNEEAKLENNIDWKEYIKSQKNYELGEYDPNGEELNYDNYIAYEKSLMEHLIDQVGLLDLECRDKFIALELVQNIDSSGYLKVELKELSSKFNIEEKKIEAILNKIQTFDPIGVGARDLKECLIIQVDYDKKYDQQIKSIIKNNLDDLAANRIQKISKDYNITIEKSQELVDYIKTLEPKPGQAYGGTINEVEYIIPDAEIKLIDGEYIVILNDITGPRFKINSYYRSLMEQNDIEEKTDEFLNSRFNRAMWIIRSIEQRRMTIKKVVESIIKFQMDFFKNGEKSLKPLTLKEVADDIEMHESTVSRVTNGKYVQTPRGIYELKYFFCTGLDCNLGEVSSTSTKELIREIVDGENPKKPYSDQKISEILKDKGIKISRRTVAKYRDELNILSSSLRRRY